MNQATFESIVKDINRYRKRHRQSPLSDQQIAHLEKTVRLYKKGRRTKATLNVVLLEMMNLRLERIIKMGGL